MDRALDDIITQNRRGRGGRGRGRGSRFGGNTGGAFRQRRSGGFARSSPYSRNRNTEDGAWEHDKFEEVEEEEEFDDEVDVPISRGGGIETGTKLKVSNLQFSVTTDDIKDLFESVGDVKKAEVDFDKSGRSLGTAIVVYARKADALKAVARYNNVPLDNKPMHIAIIGGAGAAAGGGVRRARRGGRSVSSMVQEASITITGLGGQRRESGGRRVILAGGRRSVGAGARAPRAGRFGSRGGRGGGRGRGARTAKPAASKDDLDAEMDEYNAQATA